MRQNAMETPTIHEPAQQATEFTVSSGNSTKPSYLDPNRDSMQKPIGGLPAQRS